MTPEQWKKIEALFEQALESPAAERPQLLQGIADDEQRREVESLLRSHSEAGAFLDERERFFSSENADSFLPGEVIERYRIIREIGRGGMGAVFLAERADEQYEKQVAIKLIKRGTDTDAVLRHFRNERQILAGFDHPNIARLLDGGTTASGLPYFVMEYVAGLPIDEYCKAHALSVTQRLNLFREVCAAVSYAHRRLVIHRDIKRSNILITAEGVPKLLDFGIAKILQQDDEPGATLTGLRPMTPEYASPEQVRGEAMTTASDVYSLGVVLYELLCGNSPYQFPTPSPHDVARVISEVEPKRPSTAGASNGNQPTAISNPKTLRGDLDNIVLMALRKEPERRYQSVEQFSEDIRRHLEGRPVIARKTTVGYRAAKFVQRNKLVLAAAALVLLVLVGGIIATSKQAHIATREKARAEQRFNDVRKLANRVLFDYHDAIKALPGATKVRQLLVQDALTYLDSLAGDAHGDPDLQRELAAAYERVGDVRGGQEGGGSLGDATGAIDSYMRALSIRKALVAAKPDDVQCRRDLAASHNKISDLLVGTAEESAGEEHIRKALALYLDLTKEQPANDGLRFHLIGTYNRLGSVMSGQGDYAGAVKQHRAALAVGEKLLITSPRDPKYRRAFWATHTLIEYPLRMQRDIAAATESNNRARALGEALLAEDPGNADYRRRLVATYESGGDFRNKSEEPGALERFRRAAELSEELLVADPSNALTRHGLAYAHYKIAGCLVELEDWSQALLYFSKALEGYEKVVAGAPADLVSGFLVATCHGGVARMQARLGEVNSALEECGKATALLQKITGDKPGHLGRAQAHEYLGFAYVALAESPKASRSDARQRMSAARDMFQQTENIIDEARRQHGDLGINEEWAREIAAEIAKCDTALEQQTHAARP